MTMWTQRSESRKKLKANLRWLKNIKNNYLAKTPLEKWRFVRNIHWFVLRCVGVEFMDHKYKMNIFTVMPIFLQANYYILLTYTMIYYRNDPSKALIATPALGFFVPGLILLIIVFTPSKCRSARYGYEFAATNVYAHSKISQKNHQVCDEMAVDLLFDAIRITILQLFSLALMALAPMYKFFFTDEKELMFPVILPFVDPDTQKGYYFNLANQLIICIGGAFIVPGSELVSVIMKNSFTVTAQVIRNGLMEFSDSLNNEKRFTKKHMIQLRNITLNILDFERFVVFGNQLLYWKYFVHPMIALYSISIAIFSYLMYNWIAGVGAAACLYIQLLILCDMGETVNNANFVILDGLNQFSYNLLPPRKREMFGMILHRMHTGSKIQMGPLSELNYEAANKFTRMIYTYVMAMQRMIDG